MPDLAQVDQTCLPTSTANLIIWFGHHGFPKLILSGDTEDSRDLHTVHGIMTDTDARFDVGTRMDAVTEGIEKYITKAGYPCEVEYRGLEGKGIPFTQDWLKQNDVPNKGFILLLAYCHADFQTQTYTPAWDAGHAVTLVNAEPDMLLIHDPAHENDETGRKIVSPYVISSGTWIQPGDTESAAGLLLLSGSLLEAPPDSQVMLMGAVCITMHPPDSSPGTSKATALVTTSGPTATLAGGPGEAPAAPASSSPSAPASPGPQAWWSRIFCFFFDE